MTTKNATPLDKAIEIYERKREQEPEKTPPDAPQSTISTNTRQSLANIVEDAMGKELLNVRSICDLQTPPENSQDEIIGRRFLCRRGGLVFPAPTGIGKSTFAIQTFSQAALGQQPYGLPFVRPTRTLYVQAENDEGDMAEMRDGIFEAMEYNSQQLKLIRDSFFVMTESTRVGLPLVSYVEGAIEEYKPDIVVFDPIFSYLGGSASDQSVVTSFLRNILNPVLHKHNIAAWIVHHTNKPATGEQKAQWTAGDFAYLGAGSAEFANWARAVLTIRQLPCKGIFELRAGKRGNRLNWSNPDGERVWHRYIGHAEHSICWQDVDWDFAHEQMDQAKSDPGRPKASFNESAVMDHDGYPFSSYSGAINAIMGACKCGERTAKKFLKDYMQKDKNEQYIIK